jgi:phage protein Gp37/Gp68
MARHTWTVAIRNSRRNQLARRIQDGVGRGARRPGLGPVGRESPASQDPFNDTRVLDQRTLTTVRHKSWSHASRYRSWYARLNTHCRNGTQGARDRRDERRARPCGGHRSSGRTRVICRRTPEPNVGARVAVESGEPGGEAITREELAKLAFHESREAFSFTQRGRLRAEGLDVIPDDRVQDALNRITRLIPRGRATHALSRRRAVPPRIVWKPARSRDRGFTVAIAAIHWVIVGGESGAGARPMKREWVVR